MKLWHIIGAALAASASGAHAQEGGGGAPAANPNSDSAGVAIVARVTGICVLGEPSPAAVDLGQIIALSGGRTGRIAPLGSQQVSLPNSFCNFGGTSLHVVAEALLAANDSAVPVGFARAVNYNAEVDNWAATPASVTTAATAGGGTPAAEGDGGIQPVGKTADLTLKLSSFTVPSDLLLVSGAYSGSVTITLGPAASDNE
jgi:hypothetical protein